MKKILVYILIASVVIINFSCSKNSGSTTNNNTNNTYSFTAGPSLTDINGNVYRTIVTSCGQTWTTSNLIVNRYRNGDFITGVGNNCTGWGDTTDCSIWKNITQGAYCYHLYDGGGSHQYGKLYNWYAINDPRGLAPLGWHVATASDWYKLIKCIDPNADTLNHPRPDGIISDTAGRALKIDGPFYWGNTGTNSSGFAGLPGDRRDVGGQFASYYIGITGYWWSSTQYDSTNGIIYHLNSSQKLTNLSSDFHIGASVRLVKD
jgi:uncharacterized protein (TIGR02145 family)